jgi:3-deoxy-D-manno-octulosonic acid kinase
LTRQTTKKGRSIIVYDDALVSEIDESFFDPVRWSGATTADGLGSGRGKVLFIECDGQQWALRHYCRGGLARQLSTDRFVWTGLYRTRPFREWSLLEQLHHSALPVPRPVAARVIRHGAVYTADLITVRLPDVRTLSACLSATTLSAEIWRSVGQTIARFHSADVCHADLNAHNIQIDTRNRIYLLDFDRGRIMNAPGRWMQGNLDRLHRSLTKLLTQGAIRFSDADWSNLMDGYRGNIESGSDPERA